jgi:flagellar hook assembly protein FlgD
MPGLECSFMLEIYSINGDVQWRQTVNTSNEKGIVTIPWNGCNGAGAKLNNGIYICRVTTSYDDGKKSHKEKKFILRGNK